MAEAGLNEMENYFVHHENTVTQYIVTRPIMDLCLAAECHMGTRVYKWWWRWEVLDLEGARTADCDAEQGERNGGGAERAEM